MLRVHADLAPLCGAASLEGSCRLYDKTNTGSITLQDFGELNHFLEKVQGQEEGSCAPG